MIVPKFFSSHVFFEPHAQKDTLLEEARMNLSFESYQTLFSNTKLLHRGERYKNQLVPLWSEVSSSNQLGSKFQHMLFAKSTHFIQCSQRQKIENNYFFPKQAFQPCILETSNNFSSKRQQTHLSQRQSIQSLGIKSYLKESNVPKGYVDQLIPRDAKNQMTRFFFGKGTSFGSHIESQENDLRKLLVQRELNAQHSATNQSLEQSGVNPFVFGFCQISNTKEFFARDIKLPPSISIGNPEKRLMQKNSKKFIWNVWFKLGFDPILRWNHPLSQFVHLHTMVKKNSEVSSSEKVEKFSYQVVFTKRQPLQKILIHVQNLLSDKAYPNCFFLSAPLSEKLLEFPVQDQANNFQPMEALKLHSQPWQSLKQDRTLTKASKKYSVLSSREFQTSLESLGGARKLPSVQSRVSAGKILPLYEIDCRPPLSVFKKVHFSVEEVNSKYEKLFFELYTNGSLSPLFAFECARHKILGILRFCQL